MTTIEGKNLTIVFAGVEPEDERDAIIKMLLCFIRLYSNTKDLYDRDSRHLWTAHYLLGMLLNLED